MATKRKNKISYKFYSIMFVVLVVLAACQLKNNEEKPTDVYNDFSIELAIPQFTKAIESQVVEHSGYTVSYNNKRRNPNWVAYELTAEEVDGDAPRKGEFIPDPLVEGRQANNNDYKRSGWSRGHHAPAGDMKWSEKSMEESFYLSNISAQNTNLNNGVWKSIEELARYNAKRYDKVLVVTGPAFETEKGMGAIGKNKVLIPDAFYKVLLVYDDGYKGIGFYCDNVEGKRKLSSYVLSIDSIENITGIDFFHKLPDEIENRVEKEYNWSEWTTTGYR